MKWWTKRETDLLRKEWRNLKKRELHLERNNCPTLAREVRVAAQRVEQALIAMLEAN